MKELTVDDFKVLKFGLEMLPYERYKLYSYINTFKPKNVLEVGTGTGSSTYLIAHALKLNDTEATLYTCDPERHPAHVMREYDNIKFFKVVSNVLIKQLITDNVNIDYIFFDGPEDPNVALEDLKILETHIKPGCLFSMHDWDLNTRLYDNARSIKSSKVRPYIESSPLWEYVEVLSGTVLNSAFLVTNNNGNICDSVGLCLYRFKGL